MAKAHPRRLNDAVIRLALTMKGNHKSVILSLTVSFPLGQDAECTFYMESPFIPLHVMPNLVSASFSCALEIHRIARSYEDKSNPYLNSIGESPGSPWRYRTHLVQRNA